MPGNYVKVFFIALLYAVSVGVLKAQNPIEIGKVVNKQYTLTIDTTIARKALESVLNDGTMIRSMHIESINRWHYLIAEGMHAGHAKLIAIELSYNLATQSFWANEDAGHSTCAAASCNQCVPFKENGKIIGCHCIDKQTLSNECTYKYIAKSSFYKQLVHYRSVKKNH